MFFVFLVYEEKIISSIAGYHCFVIYPEKEWNFKDKDIQTISLDILLSENDADIKNDENSNVVTVGETFIVDYEAMSSEPNKALFLEWDLSCALMEQVSSPENTKLITNESDVPSEALCLGLSGMKEFDPFEPLKMYVRMNDLDNNSDFTFKIYGLTKDLPTMKKDLDTVLEEAITKASSSTSLYEGPGNGNQDFLELEVSAEDFLSLVKTSMDKDTSDEDEELAYASAVEKGSEEADNDDVETINEAIKKSRFYVTIEDSSNTFVAKFLLSDIKSNSLYFDSAVQALKRAESSDWSEAKVVEWSEMAMLTSRSEWNSIQETSTKYKVKRFESIPLLEKPKDVDGSVQTFELNVELPKTVSASNSNLVDPNHISILVQNTDTDISFMGKGSSHRFLYLTDPMEDVNVTEKGDFLKFEWTCINHSSASRDISINVSVLLKPSPVDEMIRIGTTVSYSKHIQEESKKHITGLRLRNMIGLGLAETNSIKHSVSNFFDAFFRILFSLSDFNKRKFSKSLINKAAMDISDDFYQEITGEESLVILNLIKDSVIFSSGPDAPSTGVDEVVEFLGTLLPLVAVKTEEFRRWSFSLLDDEDFFGLLEEDDMIDLSSVIVLEPQEIKERLNGYSQVTEGFIVAGKIVRNEIDEMLGVEGSHRLDLNPDDLLESTISEIDTLSDVPIESQIQIMESASENPLNHMSKILRSLGKREMEQFKAASSKTSLESQIMKFMGKGEMKKLEVKSDEIAVEARGLMLNTTIASTSDIKMASDDDLEKSKYGISYIYYFIFGKTN